MTREELVEAIGKAKTAGELFRLHWRLETGCVANGREDFLAIERMMTERLYGGEVDASKVIPAGSFLAYS